MGHESVAALLLGTTIQLVIDYTGTNGVPQTVTTLVLRITR